MVRRLFPAFVLALFLYVVPAALAETSPTQTAAHQDGLNTESGGSGPDPDAPPGATPEESVENQYPPNTVETFRFVVGPGEQNGSFSVSVAFPSFAVPNPAIDFDIYVYRIRDNGTPDVPGDDTLAPDVIAAAASLDDPEIAEFSSTDATQPLVREDEYIVAVHNFCSQSSDPQVAPDGCPGLPDQPADAEDDWEATVTFAPYDPTNLRPSVSLSGPTTGTTGQLLTYTAAASDPDGPNGQVSNVAFDLDGDGVHETDTAGAVTASTSFARPGLYSVGVRVLDGDGAPAFSSVDVRVSGPPVPATTAKRALLQSFRLNRPVFGGRKRNKLVVRYRLREAGRAIVSLYRGKRRVRRLSAGNRSANRTYRINISPRKLRKGATYTVRLFVRSADGKRTQSVRLSAKRL